MDTETVDPIQEYTPIQTPWRKAHIGELALLNRQIDEFLVLNDRGFAQGSSEWVEVRGTTIGGSEQATIEGRNAYSSIYDLIMTKLKLKKSSGDFKTRWGNIFEEVIVEFVSRDLNTTIKGTEAFLKGRFPTQSYSPDGIGVVGYHSTLGACENEEAEPIIALFEFKCPFSRNVNSGEIPDYYLPQIYAGMDTIRLATYAIFTQGVFRRCSWVELGDNSKYDYTLWPYDKFKNCKPIAYGFLMFKFSTHGVRNATNNLALKSLAALYNREQCEVFTTIPTNSDSLFKSTTDKSKILDIGSCPTDIVEKIFELYGDKVLTAVYSPIIYTESKNLQYNTVTAEEEYNRIINQALEESEIIFGIFPWKLFKIDYSYRSQVVGYLDKWRPKIEEVMSVISKCRSNPAETSHILGQYFTSTDRPTDDICTFNSDEIYTKKAEVISNSDLLAKLNKLRGKKINV